MLNKTTFILKKRNFFQSDDSDLYKKHFLIDAYTIVPIPEQCNHKAKTMIASAMISLSTKRVNNDLYINFIILSWSNKEQQYVRIHRSFYMEDNCFGIDYIIGYYQNIVRNLLLFLDDNINSIQNLDDFIDKLENIKFEFHPKSLLIFSQEILTEIVQTNFKNFPKLNIELFESSKDIKGFDTVIAPCYTEGMYLPPYEYDIYDDEKLPEICDVNTGEHISPDVFLNNALKNKADRK